MAALFSPAGILLLIVVLSFVSSTLSQTSCPTPPSSPGDRRTNKNRLRIATFNVEWLFLYRSNCPGTGCPWENEAKAQQHLESITSQIRSLDADVLVLPEVEDCRILTELKASLTGYNAYLIPGTDSSTGQNVGLLSRVDPITELRRSSARYDYPISGSKCGYSGSGDSAVSKHFYTVLPGGLLGASSPPILLIGVHFIAFPVDPSRCAQREAQAKVIRDIVTEEGLQKGYEVVVLGDMNDYEKDFTDAAAPTTTPNSQALAIIKGTELEHYKTKLESSVPVSERYSSWYDINDNCKDDSGNEHTTIDHILFTKKWLSSHIRYARFHHSYTASCSSLNSDHWPVYIELQGTVASLGAVHEDPTPVPNEPVAAPEPVDGGSSQEVAGGSHSYWETHVVEDVFLVGFVIVVGVFLVGLFLLVLYKKL